MEGGADKGPTDFCLQDYGIEIRKLQSLVELSIQETTLCTINTYT